VDSLPGRSAIKFSDDSDIIDAINDLEEFLRWLANALRDHDDGQPLDADILAQHGIDKDAANNACSLEWRVAKGNQPLLPGMRF